MLLLLCPNSAISGFPLGELRLGLFNRISSGLEVFLDKAPLVFLPSTTLDSLLV
jgi:hypothetical protein